MLEDAFVVRDRAALARLFEDGAVLGDGARRGARRRGRSVAFAAALWARECSYLADPQRVAAGARYRARRRDAQGINVVRRARRRHWLYAISLLDTATRPKEEHR